LADLPPQPIFPADQFHLFVGIQASIFALQARMREIGFGPESSPLSQLT
jgi:hypothetical protein